VCNSLWLHDACTEAGVQLVVLNACLHCLDLSLFCCMRLPALQHHHFVVTCCPAGQEISQAFEDAAELGAAVMACGVSRDALRRLEMRRRPRWRHISQVGGRAWCRA
jgi:hypothetical protein